MLLIIHALHLRYRARVRARVCVRERGGCKSPPPLLFWMYAGLPLSADHVLGLFRNSSVSLFTTASSHQQLQHKSVAMSVYLLFCTCLCQLLLLQTQSLLADEDFDNFLIITPTERERYVGASTSEAKKARIPCGSVSQSV